MGDQLPEDAPAPVREMFAALNAKFPGMTIESMQVTDVPNMAAYEHLAHHAAEEKRVALRLIESDVALWLVNLAPALWHTAQGSALFAAGHWTLAAALLYRLYREAHHFANLLCLLKGARNLAAGAVFHSTKQVTHEGDGT